eukprot:909902-Alexandrium_andersonii.AAC.1
MAIDGGGRWRCCSNAQCLWRSHNGRRSVGTAWFEVPRKGHKLQNKSAALQQVWLRCSVALSLIHISEPRD